jgi:hypothetical protein
VVRASRKDKLTMDEILQELRALRQDVEALKCTPKTRKDPCQGVTGKGTPCRNGALPRGCHCRMHSREPKEVKAPRVKKEPKPKKTIPEHTHQIGETPVESCPLCDTHGDVMDPGLPDADFEGADDLTERLRELLSREE